ncbi:nucleoporin protein Ndc1-Nup family protein [Rhodotorula toruloides]|uniref:Nucleoporin protein Ndc1-Nup family protein n=1 Tax=Rhodotorula toruloides TaxID=5286 RepID=A0A511KGU3_RHOTO|nr:nucleoporin protein Ndc1-Nup family protein [Rhodotorula toruloides]
MSVFAPSGLSSASSNQAPPTSSLSSFLASTSVPSAPPPSQSYVQLCKVVLQRRLRNLFGLTAVATGVALYLAIFDPRELPGCLFNVVPLLLFAPVAFLGTLPVLILRKQTITTSRPPLPTLFSKLSSIRKRTLALPVVLAYLLAASILHFAYIWAASWTSRDARLGWLFFHQGRDAWQVNERRLMLAILHIVLAVWATVQHVVEDRAQVEFDDDATLIIPARFASKGRKRGLSAFQSAASATFTFWSAYVLFRRPVLRLLLAHVLPTWSRPYMYTMMRHSGAYSLTLATRAFASALLFFLAWEAAHICFEVYATHPMLVSQFAPNPNQALLSGLRASDPYYQHFAFLELSLLTLSNPSRRQAIFKDVKPGSATGGAWAEISRECLLLIGRELQRAKGRSSSAPSGAGATMSRTPVGAEEQTSPDRAPVKSGDVFMPTRPSLFDKLASTAINSSSQALGSSPAVQGASRAITSTSQGPAAQEAKQAISTALTTAVSRVPSILQSAHLISASTAQSVTNAVKTAPPPDMVAEVVGIEQKDAKLVPSVARGKVFEVSMEYRVRNRLPRRQETVSLSNLVCASLSEDPYGVAQCDIPKVLEAFVRYLVILDSVATDMQSAAEQVVGGREEQERARAVVEREIGGVQDALRSGAKAILTEFAEYLGSFRFPTRVASQLQLLVDYGAN